MESAYEEALAHEFSLRGIPYERQVPLPLKYKGVLLPCGYRLDFVVQGVVVVELKCVEAILPVHEAHLLPEVESEESAPATQLQRMFVA